MTDPADRGAARLSVQQTASRFLLEAGSLDEAIAEILRVLSVTLDWTVAIYWLASGGGKGDAGGVTLRCHAIWAADDVVQAPFIETSRVASLQAAGEVVWEELPRQAEDSRLRLAREAGLTTRAAFPIRHGDVVEAVIELFCREGRPPDAETVALMDGIAHQIGEVLVRRQAHAAALQTLERSRDELSMVLGALPDGVTVQGSTGGLIYANDAAAAAAGFSTGSEMVRAPVAEVLSRFRMWGEDGRPLSPDELPGRRALAGENHERVLRYRPTDGGDDRWVTVRAVPIRNARGQVERVVNVIHDVTDRRRREEWQRFFGDASTALGSSMELETMLQSVATLATRSIADCCAVAIRPRPGTAKGETRVVAFASNESVTCDVEDLRNVSQAIIGEVIAGNATLLRDPANRPGICSLIAVPLASRGETLGAIVLVAVSAARRHTVADSAAAEELARRASIAIDNVRLFDEAQEAVRAREDLLAIVSHDLRNPLGVVLASSALLLRSTLPTDREERARRQVEAIQRAGNRMNRLIRDLLDFASIQGGRLSVNRRVQPAHDIVHEVLESLEPLAAPKSLRLIDETASNLQVSCDHDRVIQLFSNVVGNAIKFTQEGGAVTVRAAPEPPAASGGGQIRFEVADTGPGISAEELPHVFDRYYQSRRKNREGIGLGLSIARGIVEAHGGQIWVESEEGKGTSLFFTLPRT